MMQNWEECFINQMGVLPLRFTLTVWRNGERGILSSSTKEVSKSSTCGGINEAPGKAGSKSVGIQLYREGCEGSGGQ